MNLPAFFQRLFVRPCPQPPPVVPDFEMPEPPLGSTVILEEVNHVQIIGQPESHFLTQERIYAGTDGRKNKITLRNNLQAAGCGHNLTSPDDIGFISYISKKPVCKVCEQEYHRLREQTRHEKCICRHLVAPHELSYIEGKGFVCDECKKKEKRFKHLKAAWKLIGRALLSPLVDTDPYPSGKSNQDGLT